ncbi:GNAT family N-acetyltransferase [Microbulbifer sp. TYP-18]|uniref:GNAT family N-acetyltransferase n=1 Tax=Microbulbifer sp. TYP-18 TaxID=3230024 RepID=UPI0034C5DE07
MKSMEYKSEYREICRSIFLKNVPDFFAENEESPFLEFLDSAPSIYRIVLLDQEVIGSFGVTEIMVGEAGRISWIMLDPAKQGVGAGRYMIDECLSIANDYKLGALKISASHLSEAFFKYFGASREGFVKDGWGKGMHRVDMLLQT